MATSLTSCADARASRARSLALARRATLARRAAAAGRARPGLADAAAARPVARPGRPPEPAVERLLAIGGRLLDTALLALVALGLLSLVLGRVLPATGHPVLIVAGPSMAPTIPMGSAVVLSPVGPGDLQVGDVVSLRTGPAQAIVTHRVTRIVEHDGETWIETRGDANGAVDPSLTPASAALGRVDLWLPAAGYLLTLVTSPVGVLFALSLGSLLLVGGWTLDDARASRRRRRLASARPLAVDGGAVERVAVAAG